MKICEICGNNYKVYKNKETNLLLCNKHRHQLKRYGYFKLRSKYDNNEIIEYKDCAEILLYNKDSDIIEKSIIDLDDIEKCTLYKWHLDKNGYVVGYDRIDGGFIYLHRLILSPNDDEFIDHINYDTLNNKKDNLRCCKNSENLQHRSDLQSNNTSGYCGVRWINNRSKWKAEISCNGEHIHLGYFSEKEDAIQSRIEAEEKYHKNFKSDVNSINREKGIKIIENN